MSDIQATSGADASASGDAAEGTQDTPTSGGDDGGTYPKSFVDKLKKEKDNQARKNQELQTQLDALKQQVEQSATAGLEEKEQFKTLYEQEKERSTKSSSELEQLRNQVVDAKKRSEIKSHLIKLGLNPVHEKTAFQLMDTSAVFVDNDTGAIVGAEEAAKGFHEQFKNLGLFGKAVPGVSHQAPAVGGGVTKRRQDMTKEEIIAELRQLEQQGA